MACPNTLLLAQLCETIVQIGAVCFDWPVVSHICDVRVFEPAVRKLRFFARPTKKTEKTFEM
jgi:hypothetical protein